MACHEGGDGIGLFFVEGRGIGTRGSGGRHCRGIGADMLSRTGMVLRCVESTDSFLCCGGLGSLDLSERKELSGSGLECEILGRSIRQKVPAASCD